MRCSWRLLSLLILACGVGQGVATHIFSHHDDGVEPPYTGRSTDPSFPPSVSMSFGSAAVATDTLPCSPVGKDILLQGGSAVDATIATAACVGAYNLHTSGLGGGHFMTIYEIPRGGTEKVMATIQAREWAPLASYQDMYKNNSAAAQKGGLAIAVPGEVAGFYQAWQSFGRLDWAVLFQPAINLSENGFNVSETLGGAISSYEEEIRADPNLSELFVKPDGSLVQAGDWLTNPKLGQTLRRVAADPLDYYQGGLADDIIADIAEYNGIITKDDLLAYRAKQKTPMSVPLSHGGLTAYGVSPPSSGLIYHFILNILNGYGFDASSIADTDTQGLTYHRMIEAMKFAYAKRSSLGDEDFVDMTQFIANLTSPAYGEYIRSQINDSYTQPYQYYGPDFDLTPDSGTTHMSVLAADGAAVGLTSTVNLYFGSNCRGIRTGIIFNDEMDDFSIPGTVNYFGVPASPANYITPGKMPMSSMCPTLLLDDSGKVVFTTGAAGGTRITTASSFVTMNALWLGRPLQNATDTARVHDQLIPEVTEYERHLDAGVLQQLQDRAHVMEEVNTLANVHSIWNQCDPLTDPPEPCIGAISDGRKGGAPDGY